MTDEECINNLPPHKDSTLNLWRWCIIVWGVCVIIAFILAMFPVEK